MLIRSNFLKRFLKMYLLVDPEVCNFHLFMVKNHPNLFLFNYFLDYENEGDVQSKGDENEDMYTIEDDELLEDNEDIYANDDKHDHLKQFDSNENQKGVNSNAGRYSDGHLEDINPSADAYSFSLALSIIVFLFVVFLLTICGGWTQLRHMLVVTFHKSKGSRVTWSHNGYTPLSGWDSKSA